VRTEPYIHWPSAAGAPEDWIFRNVAWRTFGCQLQGFRGVAEERLLSDHMLHPPLVFWSSAAHPASECKRRQATAFALCWNANRPQKMTTKSTTELQGWS